MLRIWARSSSSVPKGTVLQGLNIYRDQKAPVALDDAEYPPWLWTLLDQSQKEKNSADPDWVAEIEETKRDLRRARKIHIRESNAMRSKKKT